MYGYVYLFDMFFDIGYYYNYIVINLLFYLGLEISYSVIECFFVEFVDYFVLGGFIWVVVNSFLKYLLIFE